MKYASAFPASALSMMPRTFGGVSITSGPPFRSSHMRL
jgi:hypothetical protein